MMPNWFQRNTPILLTCAGTGGMIFAGYDLYRKAPKVKKAIEEAGCRTKKEKFKVAMPILIRPTIVGLASFGCFFGSTFMSFNQQASMVTALGFLTNYKDNTLAIFGENMDRTIEQSVKCGTGRPFGEVQSYCIELNGVPYHFDSTPEVIWRSKYFLNERFHKEGSTTVGYLLSLLGFEKKPDGKDTLGWDVYTLNEDFDEHWIDWTEHIVVNDDGTEVVYIDLRTTPYELDEGWIE